MSEYEKELCQLIFNRDLLFTDFITFQFIVKDIICMTKEIHAKLVHYNGPAELRVMENTFTYSLTSSQSQLANAEDLVFWHLDIKQLKSLYIFMLDALAKWSLTKPPSWSDLELCYTRILLSYEASDLFDVCINAIELSESQIQEKAVYFLEALVAADILMSYEYVILELCFELFQSGKRNNLIRGLKKVVNKCFENVHGLNKHSFNLELFSLFVAFNSLLMTNTEVRIEFISSFQFFQLVKNYILNCSEICSPLFHSSCELIISQYLFMEVNCYNETEFLLLCELAFFLFKNNFFGIQFDNINLSDKKKRFKRSTLLQEESLSELALFRVFKVFLSQSEIDQLDLPSLIKVIIINSNMGTIGLNSKQYDFNNLIKRPLTLLLSKEPTLVGQKRSLEDDEVNLKVVVELLIQNQSKLSDNLIGEIRFLFKLYYPVDRVSFRLLEIPLVFNMDIERIFFNELEKSPGQVDMLKYATSITIEAEENVMKLLPLTNREHPEPLRAAAIRILKSSLSIVAQSKDIIPYAVGWILSTSPLVRNEGFDFIKCLLKFNFMALNKVVPSVVSTDNFTGDDSKLFDFLKDFINFIIKEVNSQNSSKDGAELYWLKCENQIWVDVIIYLTNAYKVLHNGLLEKLILQSGKAFFEAIQGIVFDQAITEKVIYLVLKSADDLDTVRIKMSFLESCLQINSKQLMKWSAEYCIPLFVIKKQEKAIKFCQQLMEDDAVLKKFSYAIIYHLITNSKGKSDGRLELDQNYFSFYLSLLGESDFLNIFSNSPQKLLNFVFFELVEDETAFRFYCELIHQILSKDPNSSYYNRDYQEFLSSFFLGYLHFLVYEKLSSKISILLKTRIKAMKSVRLLIKILSNDIDVVVTQLLNLIDIIQTFDFAVQRPSEVIEELRFECVNLWLDTVKAFSAKVLLSYINEIIIGVLKSSLPSEVSVYSYLHDTQSNFNVGVLEVFDYIFSKTDMSFREGFKKVFFFPRSDNFFVCCPKFNHFVKIVGRCRGSCTLSEELDEFLAVIKRIDSLSEPLIEIVLESLLENAKLFCLNLQDTYAVGVGQRASIVLALVELQSSIRLNNKNKVLVANILGLVVVPYTDLIENQSLLSKNPRQTDTFDITDSDDVLAFVKYFISIHLYPLFKSTANHIIQDRVSFIIQELLQNLGLIDNVTTKFNNNKFEEQFYEKVRNIWFDSFPSLTKKALTSFMTSRYKIKFNEDLSKQALEMTHVYPSKDRFNDWIATLTTKYIEQMFQLLNQELFFNQVIKAVVNPFKAVLRGSYIDVDIAKNLLSTVLLYLIKKNFDSICESLAIELLSILKSGKEYDFFDDAKKSNYVLCTSYFLELIEKLDGICKKVFKKDFRSTVFKKIPLDLLGNICCKCNLYYKSLLYYEMFVRKNLSSVDDNPFPFIEFQKIYLNVQEEEPDGLEGILSLFHKKGFNISLEQRLIEFESQEKWNKALSTYEALLLSEKDVYLKSFYRDGLKKCLKNQGSFQLLIDIATKEDIENIDESFYEACWKLERWDLVKQSTAVTNGFNFKLSKILLNFIKSNSKEEFDHLLTSLRISISDNLEKKYKIGGIKRCTEDLGKLKMLYDVEQAKTGAIALPEKFEDYVNRRLFFSDPSMNSLDQFFFLYRLLSPNDRKEAFAGSFWLQQAKLARKSQKLQLAKNYILRAQIYSPPGFAVEYSKILYQSGDIKQALDEVSGFIKKSTSCLVANNSNSSGDLMQVNNVKKKSDSYFEVKALLLYAQWLENSELKSQKDIQSYYKKAVSSVEKSEKAFFLYGSFFNRMLHEITYPKLQKIQDQYENAANDSDRNAIMRDKQEVFVTLSEQVALIIKNFARSLQIGTKFIYQSLPRLITLFCDYTFVSGEDAKYTSLANVRSKTVTALESYIDSLEKRSPSYIFLPICRQLISRICHNNHKTWTLISKILLKVLLEYPQQILWQLISGVKSINDPLRAKRCSEIINEARAKPDYPHLKDMSKQYLLIAEQLINICDYGVTNPSTSSLSVQHDFSTLRRMSFSDVVIPVQYALTPTIPGSALIRENHIPFAENAPTIKGFVDKIVLMNSLMRPRKIGIYGSDGKLYYFLCKPKDDLRKDCRVLDLFNIVNTLIDNDFEAKKRNLKIKTYAVTPLNEECGIIEWVQNTSTLRSVMTALYKKHQVSVSVNQKAWKEALVQKKHVQYFTQQLLKPHQPPVLHEWFLQQFSHSPSSWFSARTKFVRTTALMSMVGFVLGLGDRHTENILLDEVSGEILHVDFNCLFEKALCFDFPERVPFRLTHNIVDAFGVTGVDGIFTNCCEIVLKCLRTKEAVLMSVLEAFIHDPLLEFKTGSGSSKKSENKTKKGAQMVLDNISSKLKGGMGLIFQYNSAFYSHGKSSHQAKSVIMAAQGIENAVERVRIQTSNMSAEGQVRMLIEEATSTENLSLMWIGWNAYM